MTQSEVIAMVREAGIEVHERKQEARIGMDVLIGADSTDKLMRLVALVAADEREACAQVAEGFPENRDWVPGSLWGNIRREVAEAIRARGQEASDAS